MGTTNWLAGFFDVTKKHHHLFSIHKNVHFFDTVKACGPERSCHGSTCFSYLTLENCCRLETCRGIFLLGKGIGSRRFCPPWSSTSCTLKMNGWKMISSFWDISLFSGAFAVRSVSFRESNWRVIFFWKDGWGNVSPLYFDSGFYF